MVPHACLVSALGRALEGDHVIFFGESATHAAELYKFAEELAPTSCLFRRTNGAQEILSDCGGSLSFLSVSSHAVRGRVCSRVYVPAGIDDAAMQQIAPSVVTSKDAAVIGYL